jgi:hypothetical protein
MSKKWLDIELKFLHENYSNLSNEDLMKTIKGRSSRSISLKASKMGLKKSKDIRSSLIGKRNKLVGRNLDFDYVLELASKFKTRSEFQIKDPSAYVTCRVNGWLDSVCSHMIPSHSSTPQMILCQIIFSLFQTEIIYNDRIQIKPLELDLYLPKFKSAFEYDGKYWHQNYLIDKNFLCQEKGIKLFTIVEKNRKYEKDIKNQIINILDEINLYFRTKIVKEDVISIEIDYSSMIFDLEKIRRICLKYDNLSDFSNKEPRILNKIQKMNLLYELTSHMSRKRNNWNEKELLEEINKFQYIGDLIKNNYKIYLYCIRHFPHLLNNLEYKKSYNGKKIR